MTVYVVYSPYRMSVFDTYTKASKALREFQANWPNETFTVSEKRVD